MQKQIKSNFTLFLFEILSNRCNAPCVVNIIFPDGFCLIIFYIVIFQYICLFQLYINIIKPLWHLRDRGILFDGNILTNYNLSSKIRRRMDVCYVYYLYLRAEIDNCEEFDF